MTETKTETTPALTACDHSSYRYSVDVDGVGHRTCLDCGVERPEPVAFDRRLTCACAAIELTDVDDVRPDAVDDRLLHAANACVRDGVGPDPVALFARLVAEVEAGQLLVQMTDDRTRAALDALALARDVLADALDALADEMGGGHR